MWRGATMPEKEIEAAKSASPDNPVMLRHDGFTSTSLRRGMAEGWTSGVLLELKVSAGNRVAYMASCCSGVQYELEVLLPRGIGLMVTGHYQQGKKTVLQVEV